MVAHLAGPATLSMWQSQFYMMRFDITQPISHQSKMLISFATKKIEDVVLMKRRNTVKSVSNARERSTSTKRSRDTVLASADPKPELRAHSARITITLPCEGVKAAKGVRVDRENAPAPDARGAMGLPESKVGWVNDCFITDR
jgi:hypothetical protein